MRRFVIPALGIPMDIHVEDLKEDSIRWRLICLLVARLQFEEIYFAMEPTRIPLSPPQQGLLSQGLRGDGMGWDGMR